MLSVGDLRKKDLERSRINHETYKSIYQTCVNHIKRQHDAGNSFTVCTVPSFLVGRTPYEHSHAIRYCVEKLQRGGFVVNTDAMTPGLLVVDWRPQKKKDADTNKTTNKTTSKTKASTKKAKNKPKVEIKEPLHVRVARLQAQNRVTPSSQKRHA